MTGPKRQAETEGRHAARRAPDAPVVLVALEPASGRPLHRQVYDGLRDAILAGRLPPGARLPSTRALAADLGVARNTVTLAFDQLRAEGYVTGARGGGTRVRSAVPDALLGLRAGGAASASRAEARRAGERPREVRVSARAAALAAAGATIVRRGVTPPVPFRIGVPALDAFPARLWARLTARRWRRGGVRLGDADPAGERALREAIAAYVANARGARCTPDQVVVVSGTQQALDLAARVLLDPGDAAWVEDPGYIGAHAPLAAAGARLVPVPVDDQGLDVPAGERAAPRARLAYVTPSHQFPLGAVMSAPRRLALLAWARRADAWVVEDDYDSEFRYTGRPLPCLQGLDEERRAPGEQARVVYVGTFSKSLAPGLRLGYLILPEELVDAVRAVRAATDRHSSTLEQGVLADFLGEGHYARHVRRVRALYAERQEMLLAAAADELDDRLSLTPDPAGLHLVGWLPPGVRDGAVSRAALAEGVEAVALSRFTLARGEGSRAAARGALLLSYAAFRGEEIRAGVRRLRRALDAAVPR
ncbi:MAG TPA: PLP-dependent aminotransferase family protein [Gemmatimonadaceae bacterium]|nr:PLP-dependent aminotransferase family protein [Gemmatimonadaceae bacterium]